MKRLFLLLTVLVPLVAFASFIVTYNTDDNRITGFISSADTPKYVGRSGFLVNPAIPVGLSNGSQSLYWFTNGVIGAIPDNVLLWESQTNYWASSNTAYAKGIVERSNAMYFAREFVNGTEPDQRFVRALVTVQLDQINHLRTNAGMSKISKATMLTTITNEIATDPK